MSNVGEASKKRHSFSLLSRRDPASTSETALDESEPANGRFIPESKRGWKYDIPGSLAPPANVGSCKSGTTSVAQARKSADAAASQRPKATGTHGGLLDVPTDTSTNGRSRAAISAPVSPRKRSFAPAATAADVFTSDSSSSDDDLDPNSPGFRPQDPLDDATLSTQANSIELDAKRHPDDLIWPDVYPWKPSLKNPKAKYIHPAHRNPTAKQAFYDTHFGSSSNYRGLLPASGSLLGLSSSILDARRKSSDKGEASDGSAVGGTDSDAQSSLLMSTVKKPFTTASKFLKARRKSFGPGSSLFSDNTGNGSSQQAQEAAPRRPHPVPLYRPGADNLAAHRSGFSYGLSLEDAAQVEAVVSRHASNEDVTTPVRLDEHLPPPASQEASSSRWKEAMNSAWGFLPSFDFFASSSAPTDDGQDLKAVPSANMLEAELIPTVKKDAGSPDYFKNLSGNVVILGGYRGSVLRDAETNMMMWIPIKVGVGLRRPTLELGLSTEAEEKSEDLVYSSEPCMSIGKLVDMGKRLEERIAGRRHAKVYAWGYDWRLSLARSSKRLIAFLEELYEASTDAQSGAKRGAKVVAHSMGGLVALHALATCNNPRIFEGLVFASTPFRGTPNILGPFRFGDAALFNDTICSPRATFSFRSSFYLLPPDGRCFEVPVGEPEQDEEDLTEQQKKQRFKDVDFLDPDVWNELGLSPCLEIGRRQQLIALARKGDAAQKDGEPLSVETSDKADLEKAAQNSAATDPDVASPQGEQAGKPNGLSMGVVEGLTDGPNPIAGDSDAELPADTSEQAALQPSNRQGAPRNVPSDPTSEPAFDSLDYAAQSWLYLDRTLSEVRSFWRDIENGFSPTHHAANAYPPIMLLTSGRTPCVRGALVGVDPAGDWRDDVRAGDYSRMTYGAGDGVITRRSATSLPGQWSLLLAKRTETEALPGELHGRGPPFGKKPGKGRMKLDRYRMRFDGEGVVESAHRHVTLLSDVDGIGKCLEAVRRANLVRGRLPLSPEDRS